MTEWRTFTPALNVKNFENRASVTIQPSPEELNSTS